MRTRPPVAARRRLSSRPEWLRLAEQLISEYAAELPPGAVLATVIRVAALPAAPDDHVDVPRVEGLLRQCLERVIRERCERRSGTQQ